MALMIIAGVVFFYHEAPQKKIAERPFVETFLSHK